MCMVITFAALKPSKHKKNEKIIHDCIGARRFDGSLCLH